MGWVNSFTGAIAEWFLGFVWGLFSGLLGVVLESVIRPVANTCGLSDFLEYFEAIPAYYPVVNVYIPLAEMFSLCTCYIAAWLGIVAFRWVLLLIPGVG